MGRSHEKAPPGHTEGRDANTETYSTPHNTQSSPAYSVINNLQMKGASRKIMRFCFYLERITATHYATKK